MRSDPAPSSYRWSALWWVAPVALLVLAACSGPSSAPGLGSSTTDSCPESEFTCTGLEVPLDHFDPDEERTIEVTFAVLAESVNSQIAYVTAVGGPGQSGVAVSEYALSVLDPEVREHFDIVFFDQRGLAMREELACPETEVDPDFLTLPVDPAEEWPALVEETAAYVAACVAELADPDVLAFLGTTQAAEDLEVFRQAGGYEKLILHGTSYGTALVQTYAASHPERVERMILDGAIDLTLDELANTQTQIEAFNRVLGLVLTECDTDFYCSEDMGMPAGDAHRALERRLIDDPIETRFAVGDGGWEELPFYVEDLWYLAYVSLYTKDERMLFLRALAAYASRDDLAPMSRLYAFDAYYELSWVYNTTVSCLDLSLPGNTTDEALEAIAAVWEATENPSYRWFYHWALTCVFWPHFDPTRTPAEPLHAEGTPTLVLATRADPATPYSHAEAIAAHLDQGHLLSQVGGSHGMFGWGNRCVDGAVNRFIIHGEIPRQSLCPASLVEPYLPLLPVSVADLSAGEILSLVDLEFFYLPEILVWDGHEEIIVGCDRGGSATFTGDDVATWYRLDDCEPVEGFIVSGTGEWDYQEGVTRLAVTVAETGCTYQWEESWEDGSSSVSEHCE